MIVRSAPLSLSLFVSAGSANRGEVGSLAGPQPWRARERNAGSRCSGGSRRRLRISNERLAFLVVDVTALRALADGDQGGSGSCDHTRARREAREQEAGRAALTHSFLSRLRERKCIRAAVFFEEVLARWNGRIEISSSAKLADSARVVACLISLVRAIKGTIAREEAWRVIPLAVDQGGLRAG